MNGRKGAISRQSSTFLRRTGQSTRRKIPRSKPEERRMQSPKTHKDLIVWRKAIALAAQVHEVTSHFPGHARQTLSYQMRRCAVSVASNIAEGAARSSRAEFIRFVDIARGSLSELETQTFICVNLNLVRPDSQLCEAVAEVGRLLSALIRRLRENRERARGFNPPLRPPASH